MASQEFQVTLTVSARDYSGAQARIHNNNMNLAVDVGFRANASAGLVIRSIALEGGAFNRVDIATASAAGGAFGEAGPDFSDALERSASFLTLTTRDRHARSAVFRGPSSAGVTTPDANEPYRYTWSGFAATVQRLAGQIASDAGLGGDLFNPQPWSSSFQFTVTIDDGIVAPDPTTVDATAGGPYTVASGKQIKLNGGGTEQNPSGATTHAWAIRNGSGGSFVDASLEDPTFQAPALAQGDPDRVFTVRYSRTNNGITDTAEAKITVTAPSSPIPPVEEPMTVAFDTPESDGGAAITGFSVTLYPLLGLPSVGDRKLLLLPESENSATTRAVEVDVVDYDDGGLFRLVASAWNGVGASNQSPSAAIYGRIPRSGDTRTWSKWSDWVDVRAQIPIRDNPGDDAAEAEGVISRYGAGLIKSGSILRSTEEALGIEGIYGTITHEVGPRPKPRGGTNTLTQVFISRNEESSYYNRDREFTSTDAQASWTHRAPLAPVSGRSGGTLDHVYRDTGSDLILVKVTDASSVSRSAADQLTYSPIGGVPDIGSGRGTLRQYGFVKTTVGNQANPHIKQDLYIVTSVSIYRATRLLS